MARAKVDFQIVNHGTIYLLYPHTRRAKQWVRDNLPQDHMKYADASVRRTPLHRRHYRRHTGGCIGHRHFAESRSPVDQESR